MASAECLEIPNCEAPRAVLQAPALPLSGTAYKIAKIVPQHLNPPRPCVPAVNII